jgi:AcrR family transcriptional regulator
MAAQRRRPSKKPPLVRGEPIVQRVLRATLDELGRVGFSALRVEDVASLARVNKTTIYRRWPTKSDLVRAALLSLSGDPPGASLQVPDTGSLRGDLIAAAQRGARIARNPVARGILRMLAAERPDAELAQVARSIHEEREAVPRSILERAKRRGDLAKDVDAWLALEILGAALRDRVITQNRPLNGKFIEQLVDLLLAGLSPRGST